MWRHLSGLYSTVNAARQFEVQTALARLEQGDRSVTDYFNVAQVLWTEQDMLHIALRPHAEMTADTIAEQQQTRVLQFLMRLRPEFEMVRSTILNREQLNFDGVISSLVREETRLRTQAQFDVRPGEGETIIAAATASARQGMGRNMNALAVTRPQFNSRVPNAELECHHCHEKGHLVKHCRRRNYCVYCKRMGHIFWNAALGKEMLIVGLGLQMLMDVELDVVLPIVVDVPHIWLGNQVMLLPLKTRLLPKWNNLCKL
ncbi:unnamed protein product [Linum trigynum]|uniref:CCHC-type domain-containing protein n=1 Tax=Linum trigynum TaxID=586398 RepID=A0AAV2F4R3_9ROSI